MARYYDAHEAVYRRLEAEGHSCWDKTPFDAFYMRPFLERALTFIGPPRPGARALDVGCGTGPIAAVLAERGWKTVGIDVSETAVRLARARVPGATFEVQDALTMPGDAQFELVVDSHCLHCIVYDEHRAQFLSTLHRLLVPDGKVIIDTMIRHAGVRFSDALFRLDHDGTLWREFPGGTLHPQRRILDPDQVRGEVRGAGFTITNDSLRAQDDATEPWALELVARKK